LPEESTDNEEIVGQPEFLYKCSIFSQVKGVLRQIPAFGAKKRKFPATLQNGIKTTVICLIVLAVCGLDPEVLTI
jgi:hypothetical protein